MTSAFDALVEKANDALDDVEKLYSTLSDAAEEYTENGWISVDAFQALIDLSPEYLKYLQDENGAIVMNEEAIKRLTEAKIDELAVSQAMALLNLIEQNLGNADALYQLAYATDAATGSMWGLVYAQLASMGLEEDLYNAFLSQINALRSLGDSAKQSIGQSSNSLKEHYSEIKDALDDILDDVMDLVKYEAEQQIEALEDQIDAYNEIVEAKKKSLELTKSELSYDKTVAEKTQEIAKLRERINLLDLDNSREASLEKAKLLEQLAELESDLAETQADHAYDIQTDSLDAMADAYEKEKQKEIEAVEESVSSTQKIYEKAIEKLQNDFEGTMQAVIAWNYEAGSSLESEILDRWNMAIEAVKEYGSYLDAVSGVDAAINSSSSGSTQLGTMGEYSGATSNDLVQQMKNNSETAKQYRQELGTWDDPSIKALHAKNENLAKALAKQMGLTYGTDIYYSDNGVWYIQGEELYKHFGVYHSGGVVDGKIADDEQFALLKKGEWVLNDSQKKAVGQLIDMSEFIKEKASVISNMLKGSSPILQVDSLLGDLSKAVTQRMASPVVAAPQNNIVVDASISVNGINDKEIIDVIKRYPRLVAEQVAKVLV